MEARFCWIEWAGDLILARASTPNTIGGPLRASFSILDRLTHYKKQSGNGAERKRSEAEVHVHFLCIGSALEDMGGRQCI